ncbi:MAG: IPTL-CTERM sorting domain-containing protein [Halothiobacillus sp.]
MMFSSSYRGVLAGLGFVALALVSTPVLASPSYLGTAQNFAVLGGSTVTNTGSSVVTGDLGVFPGLAITGFPPGMVTGTTYSGGAVAQQAQNDLTVAYNSLTSQSCTKDLTGQDLGGMTLTPGVYCFSTSAQLTGTLTLDAQGNPNAVFIFKMGSTLTTASGASIRVANGTSASACGVSWQVGSSATLGTGTSFLGNILALSSITLNTGAGVSGRVLARNGAVTMDTNNANSSMCSAASAGTGLPGPGSGVPGFTSTMTIPTLSEWAMIVLVSLLAITGFAVLRRQAK